MTVAVLRTPEKVKRGGGEERTTSSTAEKVRSRAGWEERPCSTLEKVKSRLGIEEKLYTSTEKVKSRVVAMEERTACSNTAEKVKSKMAGQGDEKATTCSSSVATAKSKAGGEEKIFVTVRVRPLSGKELAKGDVEDWECPNDHSVVFKHALPERSPYPSFYAFGKYFGRG